MVVHSSGSEKNTPLPAMEKGQLPPAPTPPTPYAQTRVTKVRARSPRKFCFVGSLVFNVLLVGALIGAGVFLCRYRKKYCEMKVEKCVKKYEEKGVEYEVHGCHVRKKGDEFVSQEGSASGWFWVLDDDDEDRKEENMVEGSGNRHRRPGHHHDG